MEPSKMKTNDEYMMSKNDTGMADDTVPEKDEEEENYRKLEGAQMLRLPLGDFEELQDDKEGMDVQLTVKGTVKAMDGENAVIDVQEVDVLHGSKLTYQERKGLKASSFAIPGKRAYPINDITHARNALARVSAYGSPEEKAKVRAAVHSKFPSIGNPGKKLFGGK